MTEAIKHDPWFRSQVELGIDAAGADEVMSSADVEAEAAVWRAALTPGQRSRLTSDLKFLGVTRRRFQQVRRPLDRLPDVLTRRRISEIRHPSCTGITISDRVGQDWVIACLGWSERYGYLMRAIKLGRWAGPWVRCAIGTNDAQRGVSPMGIVWARFFDSLGVDLGEQTQPQGEAR